MFIYTVLTLVVILGSLMVLIEGPERGFTSIPRGIYWAIVTLTTVGYGDIAPRSPLGQGIAAFVMILGYGIIAVPTGIVTAELAQLPQGRLEDVPTCPSCDHVATDVDAKFCRLCGERMVRPAVRGGSA